MYSHERENYYRIVTWLSNISFFNSVSFLALFKLPVALMKTDLRAFCNTGLIKPVCLQNPPFLFHYLTRLMRFPLMGNSKTYDG